MTGTPSEGLPEDKVKAGLDFALNTLQSIPKSDRETIEAHITGVLTVFMGAMWGTLGTEFTRGFIEAQLNSMQPGVPHDRFIPPKAH